MRAKDGYEVRRIADVNILCPTTEEVDLTHVVTLNETGLFIWDMLQKDVTVDNIVNAMLKEYDVSREVLTEDVEEYIDYLRVQKLLVE